MTGLKPCPFCGGMNLHIFFGDTDREDNPTDPRVKCDDCHMIVRFTDRERRMNGTSETIIKAWNRRIDAQTDIVDQKRSKLIEYAEWWDKWRVNE